jgi:hypothetical protein
MRPSPAIPNKESTMANDRSSDPQNRDSRSESEPATERIPGRDLAGTSYGATEREQTRDLRSTNPAADPDDEGLGDDVVNDAGGA